MSHTHVECKDSKKGDDTLIIIVNSDGTLSVDPETLQKLLGKFLITLFRFYLVTYGIIRSTQNVGYPAA